MPKTGGGDDRKDLAPFIAKALLHAAKHGPRDVPRSPSFRARHPPPAKPGPRSPAPPVKLLETAIKKPPPPLARSTDIIRGGRRHSTLECVPQSADSVTDRQHSRQMPPGDPDLEKLDASTTTRPSIHPDAGPRAHPPEGIALPRSLSMFDRPAPDLVGLPFRLDLSDTTRSAAGGTATIAAGGEANASHLVCTSKHDRNNESKDGAMSKPGRVGERKDLAPFIAKALLHAAKHDHELMQVWKGSCDPKKCGRPKHVGLHSRTGHDLDRSEVTDEEDGGMPTARRLSLAR